MSTIKIPLAKSTGRAFLILASLTGDGVFPQHLDSSPNQYIQWRYGIGEDREALEKVNLKTNDDEEKKMAEKQV